MRSHRGASKRWHHGLGRVGLIIALAVALISCSGPTDDEGGDAPTEEEIALQHEQDLLEAHISAMREQSGGQRYELVDFYGWDGQYGYGTFEARIGDCQMVFYYYISDDEVVETAFEWEQLQQEDDGSFYLVDYQEVFFTTVESFYARQSHCRPPADTSSPSTTLG